MQLGEVAECAGGDVLSDPACLAAEIQRQGDTVIALRRARRWWKFWADPMPLIKAECRLGVLLAWARHMTLPPLPADSRERFLLAGAIALAETMTEHRG